MKIRREQPSLLALKVWVFITLAGISWWVFNDFELAKPEGFDPLRYEYFARYGLPTYLLDSTSYRIVAILSAIYTYLPEFWGFLFVVSMIMIALRLVDSSAYISTAIFSPICFYYLPQTGKDGITILAMVSMVMIAFDFTRPGHLIMGALLIGLSLFIRPPIALYLPLLALQTRFGTKAALMASPILVLVFNYSIDLYGVSSGIETLADDEGAGAAALFLRRYTFGYEFAPIVAKIGLYVLSVFFQPALALLKFVTSGETFVLFEGAAYAAFLFQIVRNKLILRFVMASLPYCIVIGSTSPFYHFRYLAVAYPVIYIFARYGKSAAEVRQLFLPTRRERSVNSSTA